MHFLPCTSNYTQMSPLKLIVLMIENWMDLFMIVLICIHTCICRSHLPNIIKQTRDVQAFKIILEKKIFNIVYFFNFSHLSKFIRLHLCSPLIIL